MILIVKTVSLFFFFFFFCRCCTFTAPSSLKSINDPFTKIRGSLGGDGEQNKRSDWNKEVRSREVVRFLLRSHVPLRARRSGMVRPVNSLPCGKDDVLASPRISSQTVHQSVSPSNQPAIVQQPITSCHDCSVWPVFRNSLIHGKFDLASVRLSWYIVIRSVRSRHRISELTLFEWAGSNDGEEIDSLACPQKDSFISSLWQLSKLHPLRKSERFEPAGKGY